LLWGSHAEDEKRLLYREVIVSIEVLFQLSVQFNNELYHDHCSSFIFMFWKRLSIHMYLYIWKKVTMSYYFQWR